MPEELFCQKVANFLRYFYTGSGEDETVFLHEIPNPIFLSPHKSYLYIGLSLLAMTILSCERPQKKENNSNRILRLARRLDEGLWARSQPALPPVKYVPGLEANARFERDTIFIGQIQREFHTEDDWISVIYHEYYHYLHQGEWTVATDSNGQIVQWQTEEWYTYHPTEYRIRRSLQFFEDSTLSEIGPLTEEEKAYQIREMRKSVSRPQQLPFYYAPSHLSLEEIAAYKAQLMGMALGYYTLSEEAMAAIRERIGQQQDTWQRRKDYEDRHGLGPDGGILINSPDS